MSKITLKAVLTGVGAVNSAYLYLENLPSADNPNAIAINLFPKNSAQKEWRNNNITVEVNGALDIQVNVHAWHGTDWTLKLTDKKTSKEIAGITGTTGSVPSDGLNISITKDSIAL